MFKDNRGITKAGIILILVTAVSILIAVVIVFAITMKKSDGKLEEMLTIEPGIIEVSEEESEEATEHESEVSEEESEELSFEEESEESTETEAVEITNPDTLSSQTIPLASLTDGCSVDGLMVINIINANPGQRFRVSTSYANEQFIYVNGGAIASDINMQAQYRFMNLDTEYVFTEITE